MAQRYYYCFDHEYGGASAPTMAPTGRAGQGLCEETFGETRWWSSTHGGQVTFSGPGQCIGPSVMASMEPHLGVLIHVLHIMSVERPPLSTSPRRTQVHLLSLWLMGLLQKYRVLGILIYLQ
ncbi:hypothetical protein ES332_D01G091700v1 [Gossypium tomentosum]|uniref:Uncharacterized protein n=1 Tax=Gossypium tomentosum TaxID=34277 RepID=A0A5D2M6Y1_GOSTO|nr:hypothetical protein ES332_D01G091700v1 [Gossypium tomentosum]